MPYDTDIAGRSRLTPGQDAAEFDRTDRILLGSCAGIWLVALGAGVAATVALADLGSGPSASSGDSDTPWLLYTVIAVSAIVIVGAVPLLLRARREAEAPARPELRSGRGQPPPVRGGAAPTRALRAPAAPSDPVSLMATSPATAAADQLWLRCAVVIACAIGVAMVAIGVGTYLMAVGSTAAAWVFFVLTGLITLAMPAAPWYFLRELRVLTEGRDA